VNCFTRVQRAKSFSLFAGGKWAPLESVRFWQKRRYHLVAEFAGINSRCDNGRISVYLNMRSFIVGLPN